MLRIAFMRKNKTILSLFKQKNVVNILERNYRIVCRSKGKVIHFCNIKYFFDRKLMTVSLWKNLLKEHLLRGILPIEEQEQCQ